MHLNARGFNSVVLEFACIRQGGNVEILKIRYIYQVEYNNGTIGS